MTTSIDDWDAVYREDAPPPWDIGKPQPALVPIAQNGLFRGRVLDAGCGTGEHALLAAAKGASVLGVDASRTAIAKARAKASERNSEVSFEVGDILQMTLARDSFDTVIDCGLFHVFDDPNRERYVAVLGDVLRNSGTCYLMCFSDRQPGEWG
ncbi:MAG: class I SAM-dependent methyltransferase, partial [Acidimicrobiales bacterium]